MRILGIDPGFGIVGFGLVEFTAKREYKYLAHGAIRTEKSQSFGERLLEISNDFNLVLDKYRPDKVAIEQLFFSKNITTAIKVSEARGVIILELAKRGLSYVDVTPLQVKSALTGDGKASKTDVKKMVQHFLNKPLLKGVDDSIDALAVAIAGIGIN